MDMPAPFLFSRAVARRGFTILELLVVISILVIAVLVFATFLGRGASGPALIRNAQGIRAMVGNVRQNSAVRQVHSELVLDYRHDQVIALARRRLVNFAFEGGQWPVGSGNVLGEPSGNATHQDSRQFLLRDGGALELPDSQSSFNVPWMPTYDVKGDYEGMAVAFDYFPMDFGDGTLVSMGSVFSIDVVDSRPNCVRLSLTSGQVTVKAETWISLYRWCTVEIAVSSYGVTLYVDGRVNEGTLPDTGFSVPPATGSQLRMGGVPCRIDNFEMDSLISSQTLSLTDVQMVPYGVSPELEVQGQAENIFGNQKPAAGGPITQTNSEPQPAPPPGLPDGPVPAIVHVYFDASGKLDPGRHDGAVFIRLAAIVDGEVQRLKITIHPLGAVTWDYVDRFDWEKQPDSNLPGNTP